MLFSGIAASALTALATDVGRPRLKKISELITRATAATRKAIASAALGHRRAVTGRTLMAEAALLRSGRSLSGACGCTWPCCEVLKKCKRGRSLACHAP